MKTEWLVERLTHQVLGRKAYRDRWALCRDEGAAG
jgi:hypothetical protein